MSDNYKFETLQLHVGQEEPDPAIDARAVPIYYTLQALAQNGGHVMAKKTIYGGSNNLLAHTLPNFGIIASFVNIHDLAEVEAAIKDNTIAIYMETLGNPNSDNHDIGALSQLANKHSLPLVVDNTFGTPYLIRPIEHGADIVVHSATKFNSGHGTTLGGVIVDSGKFDWSASGKYPAISDPNPSYHGVSFVKEVGAAAFVTYIRAVFLRDTGRPFLPLRRSSFCREPKPSRSVWNAMRKTLRRRNPCGDHDDPRLFPL